MCRVASMDPVMHLSCPVTAVLDTLQHLKHTGGHLGREVGQFWSPVHTGLMGRSCNSTAGTWSPTCSSQLLLFDTFQGVCVNA